MATRWYTDPVNAPDVSPTYDGGWDETAEAVRHKLLIDAKGDNGATFNSDTDTIVAAGYYLLYQVVSEPLDAISATFAVSKGAFLCSESGAKLNGYLHLVFRKCDSNGSNPVTIGSITDDTEFADSWTLVVVNRFIGPSNLTDQALSQGDRLIIEIGFYSSATKANDLTGFIRLKDDHINTDNGENDTSEIQFNSWIETGDTFTEASGEPAAIKLGPMFAFA